MEGVLTKNATDRANIQERQRRPGSWSKARTCALDSDRHKYDPRIPRLGKDVPVT
jgi:hypothetical protein